MDIVKVDSTKQIVNPNVFYDIDGCFYGVCWCCGETFKVDYHRTRSDILHNTTYGDEDCYCEDCRLTVM